MPTPLLDVLVADLEITPSLTGLCAGFEAGRWRALELARHLFEWLPEFALTTSEYDAFQPHNHGDYLARAMRAVYESDRYQRRGEFGELLLHAAIRQRFKTIPAVSKVFFKALPTTPSRASTPSTSSAPLMELSNSGSERRSSTATRSRRSASDLISKPGEMAIDDGHVRSSPRLTDRHLVDDPGLATADVQRAQAGFEDRPDVAVTHRHERDPRPPCGWRCKSACA